eukprot:82641-Rhodomonas_salina.1
MGLEGLQGKIKDKKPGRHGRQWDSLVSGLNELGRDMRGAREGVKSEVKGKDCRGGRKGRSERSRRGHGGTGMCSEERWKRWGREMRRGGNGVLRRGGNGVTGTCIEERRQRPFAVSCIGVRGVSNRGVGSRGRRERGGGRGSITEGGRVQYVVE